MNKRHRYTLFSLGIAAIFLFGSMQMMLLLLNMRTADLLSEEGKAVIESPVLAWGEEIRENVDEAPNKEVLTMEQIEAAVMRWNRRNKVTLHDPVPGQISMEEAIGIGESWMMEMGLCEERELSSFSISAELGVDGEKEADEERIEAYFSFWSVTYSKQSMNVILYLNAVTGNVWGAEIIANDGNDGIQSEARLRRFVALAGLQSADDSIAMDSGKTTIEVQESRLYAQEHSYDMILGTDDCYEYRTYQLFVKN